MNFLDAFSSCRQGRCDPELAEAFGMKEALSWIKDHSWRSVLLETDSLVVVQALRSASCMDSYFGSIISECLALWKSLPHVDIIFVRRSANKAVHSLARASCVLADRHFLYSELDSSTIDALIQDCNISCEQ